ncbi:MAG: preprotein translocase subunit SecF [Clostridia bacterium]|jgi:preprotein translocase subunit SecF|nr:preprotein translocase subunit SecF [Clostridia bacterium]
MDFVGKRKIWYLLSLLIIVPGLFSLAIQGLNFGIDFAGGNLVQVQFAKEVTTEGVRNALSTISLKDSAIQASENNIFIIKTKVMEQSEQDKMVKTLEKEMGDLEILRSEKVGPTIGKELRRAGLMALIIAIILMIIYITIRFEFKFAVAAIVALLHDILVTVGIFSLLQIEVDSAFIAAILTIFGYSINDTIVIFDRIRENMKKTKKIELTTIVNNSIMQTLARSINTVLTVLFVLFALYFLGGETTKIFVLALLIGITSGAYSSIFTASPVWIDLRNMGKNKFIKAKA